MHKSIRSRFVRSARGPAALAAALALSLAGLALGAAPAAEASSIAHVTSTAPCNVTVTAGSGAVVGSFIVGVTAGSTQLSFDCNAASSAGVAAEASLLAGIGTTAVTQSSEADISAIAQFTASATDTGCPAGAAGACTQATFPVPANFSAGDANATCPATAAQVNAGLYGCAIAIATTSLQPLAGGEYLLVYASQTTPPAAPTIAATVADGPPGSTVTVSDAAATSSYWWANAISQSQTSALGLPPRRPAGLVRRQRRVRQRSLAVPGGELVRGRVVHGHRGQRRRDLHLRRLLRRHDALRPGAVGDDPRPLDPHQRNGVHRVRL